MKSIAAKWYECTAIMEKQKEDGLMGMIKETYTLDAICYAEAEERCVEELQPFSPAPIDIVAIKIAPYTEILFSDNDGEDKWYKTKVAFITLDEKTSKEVRTIRTYLVQASSADSAIHNIHEFMKGSVVDYVNVTVSETKIADVYKPLDRNAE